MDDFPALKLPHRDRAIIRRRLAETLSSRPEIAFAYLHGSFVDGPAFHDVDVAILLGADAANQIDPFDYEMALSVELTRALRLPVDIHLLNSTPLGFRHAVLQGEVLYAREEAELTDYIERAAADYMDFVHHLPAYLKAVTS